MDQCMRKRYYIYYTRTIGSDRLKASISTHPFVRTAVQLTGASELSLSITWHFHRSTRYLVGTTLRPRTSMEMLLVM